MTDRLEDDGRTKDEPTTKDGRQGGSAMDRRSSQKKIARGLSIDSDLSLKSSRSKRQKIVDDVLLLAVEFL